MITIQTIAIIGGISGAISGALISSLFLLYVHKLNSYRTASTKFREMVLSQLIGLYPNPVKWPQDGSTIKVMLTNIFPVLDSTVIEFRNFVPWYKKKAFDDAWFKYRCSTGRKIDTQCYHHYMGFSDMPDSKETFHNNVSHLLSFAKTK